MTETRTPEEPGTEDDWIARTRTAVIAAALPHVPFDGWTDRTLAAAVEDAGVDPGLSRLAFPRGGVDLALAFHDAKDRELAADLESADLLGLRFRDRVAHAVMRRLELLADDREAVRRAAALFALPTHAADGARAIWRTADTIWTALGDDTPGASATREFVARRIDNVMQVEGVKAKLRANPLAAAMMKGPQAILDRVRAPTDSARAEMPGSVRHRR